MASTLTGVRGSYAAGGMPNYRMHRRFPNNVGPIASCQSPGPNCSPGGPAFRATSRWANPQM
ncbi:hypothetical protein HS088_TW13G00205 [Tripterygium wilfordii]|uniref:Uncharacterized protein n=1 Tax=Tripterygium wilfordii TaxID=458696 RepID=A0A7J7CTV7_TRIWF|nr:hypothetical protein HS088_TW13G00205 [Tripterygium wilfordii]